MGCEAMWTKRVNEKIWNPVEEIWEDSIRLPCGKCLECKKKRVDQWSFRLIQEQKRSYSSYFVTLTYNNDYVPITKRGKLTLVKTTEQYEKLPRQHRYENKDVSLQGFIKRLRYYEEEHRKSGRISLTEYTRSVRTSAGPYSDKKLRYYGVGEYGSKRFRPHYHLIIFNISDIENIKKAWTFGEVHIDEVNKNTVEYTLKYINKQGAVKAPGFDGIMEFSLMSKGLGLGYVTPDTKRFHSKEYNNFVVNNNGVKVPTPRYYTEKLVTKIDKEKKAKWMAKEGENKERENERLATKDGKSYAELKVKIAMANKYKLKNPIKERGGD